MRKVSFLLFCYKICTVVVITYFEKLRTLKKISRCVKFGTKSTHFEFFFFQSSLIWGILTHFEKKIKNHILHGWLYFSCLKISNIIIYLQNSSIFSNVFLTILWIVRSIFMGSKNDCWDKSGFASSKLNQFLQSRF